MSRDDENGAAILSGAQKTEAFITVGKVLKPFGVKGHVRVMSLTDVPGRWEQLRDVWLVLDDRDCVSTTVTDVRWVGDSYIVGFSVCSTPEAAARFRGAWIKIPPTMDVPPLPEGTYYQFELIGLTVQNEMGMSLGQLEEVLSIPGNPVFVVRGDNGEVLIPATHQAIKHIDRVARVMIVSKEALLDNQDEQEKRQSCDNLTS